MANEISDNVILVNAPAGSGKTYSIKSKIRDYTIKNPEHKILCITYTNRATNELTNEVDSKNVSISTIHSYINDMISPLLGKKEIIDLYFEIYSDDILKDIENTKKQEKNNKYKNRYGSITIETIKKNIKSITYNEMQFNTLYYGGLCHDDILSFTYKILERYPKLYQKINRKFKLIIIDEYQDTEPDVLNIFFNAVKNKETKLYLYGDRMQQIYKSYNVEIKEKLESLKIDDSKVTNYRSAFKIVDILNNIYNEKGFKQEYFLKNENIKPDYIPRMIIGKSSDIDYVIKKCREEDSNTLELYVLNRKRFKQIGAENLFKEYSNIDKYHYGSKISYIDILLEVDPQENKDDLLSFLSIIYNINCDWNNKIYGNILKTCGNNKKMFNLQNVRLNSVKDKNNLYNLLNKILIEFNRQKATIGEFMDLVNKEGLINEEFMENLNQNNIYEGVFQVKIIEFIKLYKSNLNPKVSTQHGVKGESHDSVLFIAEDNTYPPQIDMYKFFELWSCIDISFDELENFYFEYKKYCEILENKMGLEIKKITSNEIKENKQIILQQIKVIFNTYKDNKIFDLLYGEIFKTDIANFSENENLKSKDVKSFFKYALLERILNAYKLFYVGCSRARKNLTVFIDEEKIKDFSDSFIKKIENVGFDKKNISEI